MASARDTYTAKLVDGPLEGRTVSIEFLDSGDPKPRLELPSGVEGKRYAYARTAESEYESSDGGERARPSAVGYRYVEAVID